LHWIASIDKIQLMFGWHGSKLFLVLTSNVKTYRKDSLHLISTLRPCHHSVWIVFLGFLNLIWRLIIDPRSLLSQITGDFDFDDDVFFALPDTWLSWSDIFEEVLLSNFLLTLPNVLVFTSLLTKQCFYLWFDRLT